MVLLIQAMHPLEFASCSKGLQLVFKMAELRMLRQDTVRDVSQATLLRACTREITLVLLQFANQMILQEEVKTG